MRINPINRIDMTLKEMTDEEVKSGYKYSASEVTRKAGNILFTGKQAVTIHGNDEWIRSVLAYGKGNKGVIICTFLEREFYKDEIGIIEHLWQTIEIQNILK